MSEIDRNKEVGRQNKAEVLSALNWCINNLRVQETGHNYVNLKSECAVTILDQNGKKIDAGMYLEAIGDSGFTIVCSIKGNSQKIASCEISGRIEGDTAVEDIGIGFGVNNLYQGLGIGDAISDLTFKLAPKVIKKFQSQNWGKNLNTYRVHIVDGTSGKTDGWTSKKARENGMQEIRKGEFVKDFPLKGIGGFLNSLRS